MNISLSWLNDYLELSDFYEKPEELAKILTDAGLEVEGHEDLAKNFDKVVIGQIETLGTHPNADRLTLCQVNVGGKELQQIVCGAKNHKQGDKVVVATPGAVLPGNFEIKVSKIRDVESRGMLCSEKELGLSDEAEGIRILPADAKVGISFAEYEGFNDIVFEVNVTPNRADCLSHIGLARELSCLLNRKLKIPKAKFPKTKLSTKKNTTVELIDSENCPRFTGRFIKGIKVGPSPQWMKARLEAVGINSINNVVDITNYVMLEYGQPLHAYDLNDLSGNTIRIEASKGEKFKSLDGTEHKLDSKDLTIRDAERVVGLAGVVGGLNSGISDDTTDVFLEAAHFTPAAVRRSARRLGIETDAAYRFSRGTDPEGVLDASNRAAALIQELAGGEVASDFYDVYPKKHKRKAIKVRRNILEERLGYPVKMSEFASWMKRLHCEVRMSQNHCSVDTPSFRWDLEIEMDLVEEYARLNGYDKIPENFPMLADAPTADSKEYSDQSRLSSLMSELGFLQAVNYSFLSPKWQNQLVQLGRFNSVGLDRLGDEVKVKNPLSEETSVMRQSLLPGLINNLVSNYHHGNQQGALFEVGQVFGRNQDKYSETSRLALTLWGEDSGIWGNSKEPAVMALKTRVELLLSKLQAQGFQWREMKDHETPELLHPGQSASLFYQGKLVGFVGTLHPSLTAGEKIRTDVAVAELDVEKLMVGQPRSPKAKKISKFPSVERDLALLIPKDVKAGDLMRLMGKLGGKNMQSVRVFDLYEGKGVPEGKSSVAFRMRFQKMDATLSDEEVSGVVNSVLEGLKKKYPVEQR